MKSIILVSTIGFVSLLYSCKKNKEIMPCENTTPAATIIKDYTKLKVGNYWIYQRFELDGMGGETALNIFDSCYVEKDTIIQGITYSKYISPSWIGTTTNSKPDIKYYRISQGNLLTENNDVEFSLNDFTTIFKTGSSVTANNDTLYTYIFKMEVGNYNVSTPSGTYTTLNFQETYKMYPVVSQGGTVRIKNNRYAENIGKVTDTGVFYANLQTVWERRLVRYHLN